MTRNSVCFVFEVLLLLLVAPPAQVFAFFVPGVTPVNYKKGDAITIQVNSLTSTRTELPFDFYSLPWCKPEKISRARENIGEILAGDRIYNSLYEARALEDEFCRVWCTKELDARELKRFARLIAEDYRVHWVVDDLPAATRDESKFEFGFPLGFVSRTEKDQHAFLHNHVHVTMHYNQDPSFEGIRIVGVDIAPASVHHTIANGDTPTSTSTTPSLTTCDKTTGITAQSSNLMPVDFVIPQQQQQIAIGEGDVAPEVVQSEGMGTQQEGKTLVIFSYDVVWKPSEVRWEDRWARFMATSDARFHWFSIVNSLMIVLLLTAMIAVIIARILRADIARYTAEGRDPDVDETGWKLLSRDVFRSPPHRTFFCICVGTGIQLGMMFTVLISLGSMGFVSVANRGGLVTATLGLFLATSVFGGYYSARFMKLFLWDEWFDSVPLPPTIVADSQQLRPPWNPAWKTCTFGTALFLPTIAFVGCAIVNAVASHEGSSSAVPLGTLLVIVAAWVCVSTPLVFVGSYFGFKKQRMSVPCPPDEIPRFILGTPLYLHPVFCLLIGGLLPFGCVFFELVFILGSVWLHQPYHVFGFLLLVFAILVVTCAEISVVLCYFLLRNLDYQWWWRAFYSSGGTAVYLFVYCVYYFCSQLELARLSSAVLFFGYTTVMCIAFFLFTGTIGFLAVFLFLRVIYSAARTQ